MPRDSVIQLGALRVRERYRVRFEAFPDCIQQFCFLGRGQGVYLLSQIVHMRLIPSAVFVLAQAKRAGI